jgi:DnaK suppressor protein
MDEAVARERLLTERSEVMQLLHNSESAGRADQQAEQETGDMADSAQPLTALGMDEAIADGMRERLATIDRALKRLDEGTYGRSIVSGEPIPDERLEADPAAELTVQEANRESRR